MESKILQFKIEEGWECPISPERVGQSGVSFHPLLEIYPTPRHTKINIFQVCCLVDQIRDWNVPTF